MEQLQLIDTVKGDRFARDAMRWTNDNPDAWQKMRRIAQEFAAREQHFGIGLLCEEARHYMRVEKDDYGFRVNNNIRAALARLLIKTDPNVEPYIETRESCVDYASDKVRKDNDI